MRRKLILALVAVCMLALAGCAEPDVSRSEPEPVPGERLGDNIGGDGGTYKFTDNSTGATCYVVQNGASGEPAIDCIQETNESD